MGQYDIFDKLCQEKNVTPYRVSKQTGVSNATLSKWKKGGSRPKYENLYKIARYFNVTVDYLMGKENSINDYDIGYEIEKLEKNLSDKSIPVTYHGVTLKEDDVGIIAEHLRLIKNLLAYIDRNEEVQ